MFNLTTDDIARFWAKVDVRGPDECWPWIAKSRLRRGYGLFTLKNGKAGGLKVIASRVSCFLTHGQAPEELPLTLHSCDNPPCCNPAHLRWGSAKANVTDAQTRSRHVSPPDTQSDPEWNAKRIAAMPKGEALWNNSLTESEARTIFKLHMSRHNVTQISAAIGKPKHVVADVCRGRSWRHLPDIPSLEELKKGGVRRGFNQFS